MSTCLTGSSMSSSLPLRRVISGPVSTPTSHYSLSEKPLASMIFCAWSRMLLMSTPMTSLAPADAANMDRIPVPQPTWMLVASDTSRQTYVKNDLVLEQVLVLDNRVPVADGTDSVLEHLLVDAKVSVRVGVAACQRRARSSATRPSPLLYSLVAAGHLVSSYRVAVRLGGARGGHGAGMLDGKGLHGADKQLFQASLKVFTCHIRSSIRNPGTCCHPLESNRSACWCYILFVSRPSRPQHRQILSTTINLSPRVSVWSSNIRRSSKNAWCQLLAGHYLPREGTSRFLSPRLASQR